MIRRIDPLLPLVLVAGLVVYLPQGFDGYLTRDLGLYAYAGQQFADGVLPYLGVMNRAGPLAHVLPGVGVLLGDLLPGDPTGFADVVAMRVLFLGFALGCLVAAYLLGRRVFDSRAAGLLSATTLLVLHGFIEYATHGPREKTPMVLFTYLALLAVAHRRWATAGVLVSLATLTWQPVLVLGLAAAVAGVLLLDPGRRLAGLVRVAVGGLVPLGITVLVYAAAGELPAFLDGFVLANAQHTTQTSFLLYPLATWQGLVEGFGWTTGLLLVGAVAFLALGVRAAQRLRQRHGPDAGTADRVVVALAAGHLAGLVWSLFVFNGWGDAFFLMPTITLGVGGGLALLLARPARPHVATAGAALVAAGGVVAAVQHSTSTDEDQLRDQDAAVAAALDGLPPEASVLSIEAPQPLVLAQLTNPSRHQMFLGGLDGYVDEEWPGGMDGYADWVAEEAPTVLALQEEAPAPLAEVIEQDYRHVGEAPGWSWYVHESVP